VHGRTPKPLQSAPGRNWNDFEAHGGTAGSAGTAAISVLLGHVSATAPHMPELRHLGGALARPAAAANAVSHRDAQFNVFTSPTRDPPRGAADLQADSHQELRPWSGGRMLYNLAAFPQGHPANARLVFSEPDFSRLRRIKAAWGPATGSASTCHQPN
jgi:hypothetical protein